MSIAPTLVSVITTASCRMSSRGTFWRTRDGEGEGGREGGMVRGGREGGRDGEGRERGKEGW